MDNEIAELIDRKSESANLDYKEGFVWNKENRDKQFELLKDLMGMANTRDGGTVIVGVKDGSYELVGVSEEVLNSFDQSKVGEMLHRYAKPKIDFQIVKTQVRQKNVVVIRVAEFQDVPILSSDTIMEANNNTRVILRKSAIYIRTSAATTAEVPSDQEMRELIGRAMGRRGDELLHTLERLISGKPIVPSKESLDLYEKEIQDTDAWILQVLKKGFLASSRWELIVYPSHYQPDRISELPMIEKIVKDSEVSLRGWPFPYIGGRGEASNFNSGYQGFVDWNDIREAFRFHKSGLFVFKRAMREDLVPEMRKNGEKTLSFVGAIYSLTEWLLFLSRAYESLATVESVKIDIKLIGCKGRGLASFDILIPILGPYVSDEDVIVWRKDVPKVQLHTSAKEIAAEVAKHIFHVFNWTDVSDETIAYWQNKLITRSY